MASQEQQDIFSLRQRVYKLEQKLDYLFQQTRVEYLEDPGEVDDPRVIDALRSKDLFTAIAFYREVHHVGLAEAKSAVEGIKAKLGI
jgi:hypothetical protein